MASKKNDPKKKLTKKMPSRKKPSKKAAPIESPAARVTKSLFPDHVTITLMLGGVAFGFVLYLLVIMIAPSLLPSTIAVENVQFLREEGEMSFTVFNNEEVSNTCQAVVVLSSGDIEVLRKSIGGVVLKPYARQSVSFEADIPEGKFDYDIEVSCNPTAGE